MSYRKKESVEELIQRVMRDHPGESPKALACYFEAVHQELAPLARELERENKSLRDSKPDDVSAMRWISEFRFAVGDDGKRMLPEFVEYLKQIKKQRDDLLAALEAVQAVANESDGIAGWHKNGDVAAWDEVLPEIDAAISIVKGGAA